MKTTIVLLLLIFNIDISSAQKIPKKSSEIIAETHVTGKESFDMLLEYLFEKEIRTTDKDSVNLYIVTEGIKPSSDMLASYRIIFTCRDEKIKAKIETRLGYDLNFGMMSAQDQWRPALYQGMGKKAFNKNAFHDVTDMLKLFSDQITYK